MGRDNLQSLNEKFCLFDRSLSGNSSFWYIQSQIFQCFHLPKHNKPRKLISFNSFQESISIKFIRKGEQCSVVTLLWGLLYLSLVILNYFFLYLLKKKKNRRKRTRKYAGSVLKVFISDSKLLSKNSTVGALLMCFLPITPTEFA